MNIVEALQNEEAKLQRQLAAVKSAIAALNGGSSASVTPGHTSNPFPSVSFIPTSPAAVEPMPYRTLQIE
jgi:hypothetical protein